MQTFRFQRGLAAAAIFVVLIIAAVLLVVGRGFFQPLATLGQREVTDLRIKRITEALVSYVALNRYLPCPAQGNDALLVATPDNIGKSDPEGPTTSTCNSPDGVVPWRTIGLRRDDGLDGWGRKISFRVFSGASGFTIPDGLSMTNCNASLGAPINLGLGSALSCMSGSPPPNTPDQFLAARGDMLAVRISESLALPPINGNAFVLISHGESGNGAYLADIPIGGTARAIAPASASEIANMQATGTYWSIARSAQGVQPAETTHFDDIVVYMSASELATKARLAARPWSNFPLSATFSRSEVETALGISLGTAQDTGRASLSLGGFLVTANSTLAMGGENIGFREQGSVGGIGVYSGGSDIRGDIDSNFSERLTFQLGSGSEYGKMDLALNRFAITDNSPLRKERAEISFWKAGEPVQTTTVDAWDFQSNPSRCLLRLVFGGAFDRMDVASVAQTNSGGNSRFTVAGVKACTDSTTPCTTSVSGAVACPIPPPSSTSGSATSVATTTATIRGTVEDNGVSKGSGTGYRTSFSFFTVPVGTTSLTLTTGSGTILAGNCLTISGDGNTYVVAAGINAPGTLVLADPGLLQSIPSFTVRNVTVTHCLTTVSFDYGITGTFGSSASASPGTINAGAGSTNVSASISGLTCNTGYFFRTKAVGQGAITTGNCSPFKTTACSDSPPAAVTSQPTSVGAHAATLKGVVKDNGFSTTVVFDYGLSSCYESSAPATPGSIAAGTGETSVSAPIAGLFCNTTYHYRTRAVSVGGTTTGSDNVFQTAACP